MKKKTMRNLRWLSTSMAIALTAAGSFMLHASTAMLYPGDLDLNNRVDVADAVFLCRLVAEDTSLRLRVEAIDNADVNMDGEVNANDITTLLKQLAGILPTQGRTPNDVVIDTTPAENNEDETNDAADNSAEVEETVLNVNGKELPLDVSLSYLTGTNAPTEQYTVAYVNNNIIFSVYAEDPADLTIAITADDTIIGYYFIGGEFEAPDGYIVTEYVDDIDTGKTYAALVLKGGYSIQFTELADRNDLYVFGRLNAHAANAVRAINGFAPFAWDEATYNVAKGHSQDMADNNFFAHESSDGRTASARMTNAGIDWAKCSENVDCGYTDPFLALDGWYNSPNHRVNLLRADSEFIGTAFAYNEDSTFKFYGTQDFYRGWGSF